MSPISPRRYFTPGFVLVLLVCVTLATIWRSMQSYPLPLFDLYPLYYGAQGWLRFGNAYDLGAVVPATDHPFPVFQIGNGYPLPAVLLTLPFSFLPPTVAAMCWVAMLTAGLLLALRLHPNSWWMLVYLPLLEGLRMEQYTVLVVIFQLVALWAVRTNRLWILAICCALILTKPTQGAFFVATLLVLARPWRQFAAAMVVIWGGSLLLDPGWLPAWFAAARTYVAIAQQPVFWWIGLCALPLLWTCDWISAAVVLQMAVSLFPDVYVASALPLGLLKDRRGLWLAAVSFLWPFPAIFIGRGAATLLTLALPLVVLLLWRWYTTHTSVNLTLATNTE